MVQCAEFVPAMLAMLDEARGSAKSGANSGAKSGAIGAVGNNAQGKLEAVPAGGQQKSHATGSTPNECPAEELRHQLGGTVAADGSETGSTDYASLCLFVSASPLCIQAARTAVRCFTAFCICISLCLYLCLCRGMYELSACVCLSLPHCLCPRQHRL